LTLTLLIAQLNAHTFDEYTWHDRLGGVTGAMLLGSDAFCESAAVWRRRFGGTVYTYLPYWAHCAAR
jgi:hypothetical protein